MHGHWIESHGFEMLVIAFLYSGATSKMPPLPLGCGWWTTWFYSLIKLSGANLGNLVNHTPMGAQMESMVSKQVQQAPDGTKTVTQVAATSATEAQV